MAAGESDYGDFVAPGLYDKDGELHFDVPEFLAAHGIPDTPENRDTVTRAMVEEFRKRYPGVPVYEVPW